MKNLMLVAAFVTAAIVPTACDISMEADSAREMAEGDYERGPNNGRMLRDGDLADRAGAIDGLGVSQDARA